MHWDSLPFPMWELAAAKSNTVCLVSREASLVNIEGLRETLGFSRYIYGSLRVAPFNLKLLLEHKWFMLSPVGIAYLVGLVPRAKGVNSNRLSMNIKRPPGVPGQASLIKTLLISPPGPKSLSSVSACVLPPPHSHRFCESGVTKSIFFISDWPRDDNRSVARSVQVGWWRLLQSYKLAEKGMDWGWYNSQLKSRCKLVTYYWSSKSGTRIRRTGALSLFPSFLLLAAEKGGLISVAEYTLDSSNITRAIRSQAQMVKSPPRAIRGRLFGRTRWWWSLRNTKYIITKVTNRL